MPITPWEDRRGLFQKGREVHQPSSPTGRRASEASITEAIARTVSNSSTNADATSPASPTMAKSPFSKPDTTTAGTTAGMASGPSTGQRRRSSASSSGMFGNLTGLKRGSHDYTERRGSIQEMQAKSGILGGLWNSSVRGINAPKQAAGPSAEAKRGVME